MAKRTSKHTTAKTVAWIGVVGMATAGVASIFAASVGRSRGQSAAIPTVVQPSSTTTIGSINSTGNAGDSQIVVGGDIINAAPDPAAAANKAQQAYEERAASPEAEQSRLYFPNRFREVGAIAADADRHLRAASWDAAQREYNYAAYSLNALIDEVTNPSAWLISAWDEVQRAKNDRLHGAAPLLATYLQVISTAQRLGEAEHARRFFADGRLTDAVQGSGVSGLFATITMDPHLLWAFPRESASVIQPLLDRVAASTTDNDVAVELRVMVASLRGDIATAESLIKSVNDPAKRQLGAAVASLVLSKTNRQQDALRFASIASKLPKEIGVAAREHYVSGMQGGDATAEEIQLQADAVQTEREHEAIAVLGRMWAKMGHHEQAERALSAAQKLRETQQFDRFAVRQMSSNEAMIRHDIIEYDLEAGNLAMIPRQASPDRMDAGLAVKIVKAFTHAGHLDEAESLVESLLIEDTQWERPRTKALLYVAAEYHTRGEYNQAERLWNEAVARQVPLAESEVMPIGYADRVMDLMVETAGLLYDAGLLDQAEQIELRALERYNTRTQLPRDERQKEDRELFGSLAPYFFGDERSTPNQHPRVFALDRQRTAPWVRTGMWSKVDSFMANAADPSRPSVTVAMRLGIADGLAHDPARSRKAARTK